MYRIIFTALSLSTLITLTACDSPEPIDATSAATKMAAHKVELPPNAGSYTVLGEQAGLKNFVVRYDEKIFRGGAILDDSANETLKKWEIKTVVSVTPTDEERAFCKKFGYTLVEIPFAKTGPSSEQVETFKTTVESTSEPIYVHCKGGTHRAGLLGFVYRTQLKQWSQDKALVEYGRLGGDLKADHAMLKSVLNTNE